MQSGDLTYAFTSDGSGIIIQWCSFSASGTVTIPEKINGTDVVEISGGAFLYRSAVTNIVIPDSVTKIGVNAFLGTGWHDSLSDGPVYAGKVLYSYKGTMPENTVITIAQGTLSVVDSAFSARENLTGVVFADSVRYIGSCAFSDCTALSAAVLPGSLVSIGSQAFSNCTSLSSVTVNSDIAFIGSEAFLNTPWLNSQPAGPLYVGKTLYKYCGKAQAGTALVINAGTLSITEAALLGCTGISSISIPASVADIGFSAFMGCSSLESVTVDSGNTHFLSLTGVLFDKNMYSILLYPAAMAGASYTIPDGVCVIDVAAFYQAQNLTEVNIPDSVLLIFGGAFAECALLESITLPKRLSFLDEAAFMSCPNLLSVSAYCNELIMQESTFYDSNPGLVIHSYSGSGAEAVVNTLDGAVSFEAFGGLSSQTLDAAGAYIKGLPRLSTLADFSDLLTTGDGNTLLYSRKGVPVTDTGALAGTGTEVTVFNSAGAMIDYRTLVIPGDVSGDSVTDALDLITVELALSGNVVLEGAYRAAVLENYSFTDDISASDYAYVERLALS